MAKDNRLPDGAWFALGAIIGAVLSVAFVTLVMPLALPIAVGAVLVGSFLFGGLAVAIREDLLYLFLP